MKSKRKERKMMIKRRKVQKKFMIFNLDQELTTFWVKIKNLKKKNLKKKRKTKNLRQTLSKPLN